MEPGLGYWLKVSQSGTWVVSNGSESEGDSKVSCDFNGNHFCDYENSIASSSNWDIKVLAADSIPEVEFEMMLIQDEEATVAHLDKGEALRIHHGFGPNGGGDYVNDYTIVMDVMFPKLGNGDWISLYNTEYCSDNTDSQNPVCDHRFRPGGDWFVDDVSNGLGISGDYSGKITVDTWHRLALTINSSTLEHTSYIDGIQVNKIVGAVYQDGRFSLYHADTALYEDPLMALIGVVLFGDENGNMGEVYINSVHMYDRVFKQEEVGDLGGAHAGGINSAGDINEYWNEEDFIVKPYLQDVEPNSIHILWETMSSSDTQIEWGKTKRLGQSTEGSSFLNNGSSRIHTVNLENLDPDTIYHYRVRAEDYQSKIYHFRTPAPPEAESSSTLVIMSDMQKDGSNPDKFLEIINDGVLTYLNVQDDRKLSDDLNMILIPGDLVVTGSVYSQWADHFFTPAEALLGHVPMYPVLGNHEQNSQYYFNYFHLPDNGSLGYEEHWWYKDHSNIRVVGLDSNGSYRISTQLNWLDDVLGDACKNPNIDFVFAQLHHPYKSELWIPGETNFTGEVVKRLENFSTLCDKPSIHFFGHTHGYSRGQSQDHDHLWVNVAIAGGNIDYWGEYAQEDYHEFTVTQDEWGFVVVDVEAGDDPQFSLTRISRGNEVMFRDNEIRDEITVRMNNTSPETPEGISPKGEGIHPDLLTLEASKFVDGDQDERMSAHWVIYKDCDLSVDPVVDKLVNQENWYFNVNTQKDANLDNVDNIFLNGNSTYCWQVRYRDSGLAWSDWSDSISFQTAEFLSDIDSDGYDAIEFGGPDCDDNNPNINPDKKEILNNDVDEDCDGVAIKRILFEENFDDLELNPFVSSSESGGDGTDWTDKFPLGWTMETGNKFQHGVTAGGSAPAEYDGWTFLDPESWNNTAGGQGRDSFTKGHGVIAVADSDEFDDISDARFDASLTTLAISLQGLLSNESLYLRFDSSWQQEPQEGSLIATFNNGNDPLVLLELSASDPTEFNRTYVLSIENSEEASEVNFTWSKNGHNNWWWAIDNIILFTVAGEKVEK